MGKLTAKQPEIITNYCVKCAMPILAFTPNKPDTICWYCKKAKQ